jgi:hypothetical protein
MGVGVEGGGREKRPLDDPGEGGEEESYIRFEVVE